MMPLGAPSISKYGSLVRPDAQIVAMCAHCARTARALRLRRPLCPARAQHATFLLTIRTTAPDLSSHGEAPQVDHVALHTLPTKHVA